MSSLNSLSLLTMSDEANVSVEFLQRQLAEARAANEAERVETGGGGNNTGGMNPWQQSVETRLGNLETRIDRDFKITWGGILLLAILGVGCTAWLTDKMFAIQGQLGEILAAL